MKIKHAWKEGFYPTPEQETLLAQSFDYARFVYNNTLWFCTDADYKDGQSISHFEAKKRLVSFKAEFPFLADVSSVILQQTLRDQQEAFKNFWAGISKVQNERKLANKQKGSNNRAKARLRVARLHAKIVDCRAAHKASCAVAEFSSSKRCSGCGFVNESLP